MSSVVVEFFGMPGVGKSYLSGHLVELLRNNGVSVSNRAVLLSQKGSFQRVVSKVSLVWCFFLNNDLRKLVPTLIKSCKISGIRKKVKVVFNWLYVLSIIKNDSVYFDCIVLDQGLGQALWSTLFYGEDNLEIKEIECFFKVLEDFLLIKEIYIVQVRANDEIIKDRIKDREGGKSPLDNSFSNNLQRATQITKEVSLFLEILSEERKGIHISDLSNCSNEIDIIELEYLKEKVLENIL